MDDRKIFLGAEISKINFLLENLYAVIFRDHGAGSADVPTIAEEMLRQASLPGTTYGDTGEEGDTLKIRELASHRLAMFFVGVQERLRSQESDDQDPDS